MCEDKSACCSAQLELNTGSYLYISEWMKELGLTDDILGKRLNRAPATVWRWRNEQQRLNPAKIAQLAAAMGLHPVELFNPPDRPSLDAILMDAPPNVRVMAVDIVRRLAAKS